jgi:aromatic-L-amino-acid/L-tryptophan decarboxylase
VGKFAAGGDGCFRRGAGGGHEPELRRRDHAAIWVEREVIGWFRQIFGFPPESTGLLVSGGSMAALTALGCGTAWQMRFRCAGEGLAGSAGG